VLKKFDGLRKRLEPYRHSIISFFVVALVWEGMTRSEFVPRYFLPPLSDIAAEFWQKLVVERALYGDIAVSIWRILAGFFLSVLFGVACGIAAGLSKKAERLLVPSVTAIAPVPKVAFLPLFVIWFGIGEIAKILVVFANNFYQLFINTFAGLRSVDQRYIWAAASMGLSRYEMIRFVILPGALPYIVSGARITAPVTVVIIVLAEMIAAKNGIGFYTYQMARDYRLVEMFVGLAVLGLLSLCFDSAVKRIGRRLIRWE
jgi:ABC-type nitrate/sulfonate/bicarbonate transport system permease component